MDQTPETALPTVPAQMDHAVIAKATVDMVQRTAELVTAQPTVSLTIHKYDKVPD